MALLSAMDGAGAPPAGPQTPLQLYVVRFAWRKPATKARLLFCQESELDSDRFSLGAAVAAAHGRMAPRSHRGAAGVGVRALRAICSAAAPCCSFRLAP